MISYASKYRSSEEEIMDNFELGGKELERLLRDLKVVNTWLGGNRITLQGIKKLIRSTSIDNTLTIVDLGCGDGEMLRQIAGMRFMTDRKIHLIGVDANENILDQARLKSADYNNITYQRLNVLNSMDSLPEFDIALCTLFLHHFQDAEIVQIMEIITKEAKVGVVVNDLHRSKWAFQLFKIFSGLAIKTKIAKHDGLVSIARAFKKQELINYSKNISGSHFIRWRWAFRYQWIISK